MEIAWGPTHDASCTPSLKLAINRPLKIFNHSSVRLGR